MACKRTTTPSIRRFQLQERMRVEQKRAKARHHVSQACDGCRSRKRACSAAQVLPCNECGSEHEFCERCLTEGVHCHFPPPEADGRRTSNKQLVTELELQVASLKAELERVCALARRHGINPDAGPSPALTVAIPETTYQFRADSTSPSPSPSPSPASLVSPSSPSFQSSASPSPQSGALENSHYLAVPSLSPKSRHMLKHTTSLNNMKSQAALLGSPSMLEPRLPLSANSSPLPQMRDLTLGLGHGRSFSNPESDGMLAYAAQYHTNTFAMYHGGVGLQQQPQFEQQQQTTQGLGLALSVPTVHFHPASPAASPPAPAPARVYVPAATANQHQPALHGMFTGIDPSMWGGAPNF